jgi:hypothetical protein
MPDQPAVLLEATLAQILVQRRESARAPEARLATDLVPAV